jgi:hypothetical protein
MTMFADDKNVIRWNRHIDNQFGKRPGLNPTIIKTREKFCFLYAQKILYRQIFPVEEKTFSVQNF